MKWKKAVTLHRICWPGMAAISRRFALACVLFQSCCCDFTVLVLDQLILWAGERLECHL